MKSLTKKHCLRSQIHLGHSVSEWNPNMSSFLMGQREGSHIFDIPQTLFLLRRALKMVKDVASKDGLILFLGRSPSKVAKIMKKKNPFDKILENAATQCSQPYLTGQTKWVNGTFTNWEERTRQFSRKAEKELRTPCLGGGSIKSKSLGTKINLNESPSISKPGSVELKFDTYKVNSSFIPNLGKTDKTPYYQSDLNLSKNEGFRNSPERTGGLLKENKLQKNLGNRFSRPDLIFGIGISELQQPLKEANSVGIPIVGVVDSNQNPFFKDSTIDYIIPGNDDSIRSYAFFCMLISQAILEGKKTTTSLLTK